MKLSLFVIAVIFSFGCSEFSQPEYSDDDISQHAKEKASAIVYNFYDSYELFSLSTKF